eukprot:13568288-Alexandrium_andersonii.AAC.1
MDVYTDIPKIEKAWAETRKAEKGTPSKLTTGKYETKYMDFIRKNCPDGFVAVSYTHLTLPTICSV